MEYGYPFGSEHLGITVGQNGPLPSSIQSEPLFLELEVPVLATGADGQALCDEYLDYDPEFFPPTTPQMRHHWSPFSHGDASSSFDSLDQGPQFSYDRPSSDHALLMSPQNLDLLHPYYMNPSITSSGGVGRSPCSSSTISESSSEDATLTSIDSPVMSPISYRSSIHPELTSGLGSSTKLHCPSPQASWKFSGSATRRPRAISGPSEKVRSGTSAPVKGAKEMYFFTQTMGEQLALGYLARYAFEKQYTGLVNRDEKPTFGKCSSNISIHMKIPGYLPFTKQVKTHNWRNPRGPITISKLVNEISKVLDRYLEHMEEDVDCPGIGNWGMEKTKPTLDNIFIDSVSPFSRASWEVELSIK